MAGVVNKIVTCVPTMASCAVQSARPRLATFWRYAKVELRPPSPSEFGEVSAGLSKLYKSAVTGKWRQVTVKEAAVNTMIGLEIAFCFFIGETIGRGHLLGYPVPGTVYTGPDM